MSPHIARIIRRAGCLTSVLVAASLVLPSSADARVKKIVVEKKVSPAFDGASFGSAGLYETLAGRAFGELDPNDPRNALITDIKLAPKNARGMVEYIASDVAASTRLTQPARRMILAMCGDIKSLLSRES